MNEDELTKKQIEAMSDSEVKYWFQKFAEDEQVTEMRKRILNHVEIYEAKKGPRIHVDSTVVD